MLSSLHMFNNINGAQQQPLACAMLLITEIFAFLTLELSSHISSATYMIYLILFTFFCKIFTV